MRNFFLRWIINGVALWVAVRLVPGIRGPEDLGTLALVALLFGLVNAAIGPLLRLLTCPLILVTMGLFTLVVNGLLLWLSSVAAGWLSLPFHVQDFGAAFLG
ncbi:MAG: phage holin family protein, partial [Chloroflexi bacterium]|nr:phage holin family protein [Chloroflexota bacterium]